MTDEPHRWDVEQNPLSWREMYEEVRAWGATKKELADGALVALERIYQVARYGEEGRDDYENLNTIIETAGRVLGKPEAEWHR